MAGVSIKLRVIMWRALLIFDIIFVTQLPAFQFHRETPASDFVEVSGAKPEVEQFSVTSYRFRVDTLRVRALSKASQ